MTSGFGDDDALLRRCENAWVDWLAAQDRAVTGLTDAHGNVRGSRAPSIQIEDRTWVSLLSQATGPEKELLGLLAEYFLAKPVIDYESDEGLPLTVSWPDRRLVLDIEFVDDEREELNAEEWTIVEAEAEVDAIRTALSATGGTD